MLSTDDVGVGGAAARGEGGTLALLSEPTYESGHFSAPRGGTARCCEVKCCALVKSRKRRRWRAMCLYLRWEPGWWAGSAGTWGTAPREVSVRLTVSGSEAKEEEEEGVSIQASIRG